MPRIKFNLFTKEIEMKGSESFIEANIDRVRELWAEGFGVKETKVSRRRDQESMSAVKKSEGHEFTEVERHPGAAACPFLPATAPPVPAAAQGRDMKRPPMRKYIRKEGLPGQQRVVVEVAEQKPKEISIAALKEKFGLSESKIGDVMRDAERLGKIKRVVGGSYSWS